MLRSLEGGIGSPSLLLGLSPETGKARSCLEQQHDCDWVGCCCCCYGKGEYVWGSRCSWVGFTPSQCCAVSHQCRQERICELSTVLSLVPLLLPAFSLPMARVSHSHGSVQKAKFDFADITEKSEPALASWKTSNLLQCCLQRGWAGITFLPSYYNCTAVCRVVWEREILQPSGYSIHLGGEDGGSICCVKVCLLSDQRKQKNKEGKRR